MGRRDETMTRGDTLPMFGRFSVEGLSNPLDGSKCWFTLKRRLSDPDELALVQKTYHGTDGKIGGTLEVPDEGDPVAVYSWRIEEEDTQGLTGADLNKQLEWDCQYIAPDGNKLTIRGTLRVLADVTHATG